MLQTVTKTFPLAFSRSGGAIIVSRLDVWEATKTGWKMIASYQFSDPTQSTETVTANLPKGSYTGVFQCFVQESLNGKYQFDFEVNGASTFLDDGDVNTTSSPNDAKAFKDQFILNVK